MNSEIIESTLNVDKLVSPSFFEMIGLGAGVEGYFSWLFSYGSLTTGLKLINFIVSFVLVVAVVALVTIIFKIFAYTIGPKFIDRLKLLPLILDKNQFEFFQKYCHRDENGTFSCSFSKHQKYRFFTKISLHSAVYLSVARLLLLIIIFVVNYGYSQAFEGRTSTNYTLFIDSQISGGGSLASTNYTADSSFGEPISGTAYSNTYTQSSGITALSDEPHISFTVEAGLIPLGIITNQDTSYSQHLFTASYNGNSGYDIAVYGYAPTNEYEYQINPIGSTAQNPTPGTEQFGLNLRGNTSPAVVGADPSGGGGEAFGQYAQVNKFAFSNGEIIARSTSLSSSTNYTATLITNISPNTPAGSYIGEIMYSIIPKF